MICYFEVKPPDPCINNPCKNGGRCKAQGAHFICECPKNYEGLLCDCCMLIFSLFDII
jgi:hypothetical protein